MSFANQYSFLVFATLLGVILFFGLGLVPTLSPVLRFGVVGVYALAAIVFQARFHYPDSPVEVESVADVEAVLTDNKPTFVMLYSNF